MDDGADRNSFNGVWTIVDSVPAGGRAFGRPDNWGVCFSHRGADDRTRLQTAIFEGSGRRNTPCALCRAESLRGRRAVGSEQWAVKKQNRLPPTAQYF